MKASFWFALVFPVLTFPACTQNVNVEEQNETVVRNWFEEGWNQHNPDVIDTYFAADYANPGLGVKNVDEWKQLVNAFLTAFPDIHITIDELMADGDKVATRVTATGTHQGPYMEIPPTGKTVTISAINVTRLADGKVVEDWSIIDAMGLMQQLQAEKSDNPFIGKWDFFEQVSVDGEDGTRESTGFDIYLENGFYIHTWMLLDGPGLEKAPETLEDYKAVADFYQSQFGQYTYNLEDSTITWGNEGNLLPHQRNTPWTFKFKIVQDTLFYRFPEGRWIWKVKRGL